MRIGKFFLARANCGPIEKGRVVEDEGVERSGHAIRDQVAQTWFV